MGMPSERSTRSKAALILFNVAVIFLLEAFITHVQSFAIESAVALQKWGKAHNPDALWFVAEGLGVEPRTLTFVLIALFARDAAEATRLLTLRFCAHYLRWILGAILQEPRPSWISHRVEMLHCPSSFGLPSGHSILAMSVLFPLAFGNARPRWSKALLLVWYILMCIGRVYLGTHSPHDLFIGLLLGLCLVYVVDESLMDRFVNSFRNHPDRYILCFAFLAIGIANSVAWSIFLNAHADVALFKVWEDKAAAHNCSHLSLFSSREGISAVASFFGVLLVIARSNLQLSTIWMRLLACAVYFFNKQFVDMPKMPESIILSGALFATATFLLFQPSPEKTTTHVDLLHANGGNYGTI